MKRFSLCFTIAVFLMSASPINAQVDAPENGNPLVPGYFADPTIKKFGDTWYLYATTDGIKLASGDPQVWVSKDFENWCNYKMELPNRKTQDVWAPDVVQGPDGRYYYYYSSCRSTYGGCNIFAYVSDTPIGPWESLTTNGEPVIPANFFDPVIPLDPHVFVDEDSSYYIYFCTWAVYDGNGVGWAKMNPDMKSFSDKGMIPNTQLPSVFEAPFMIKHEDTYFLSYSGGSTHDGTYRVLYSTSDSPTGTFTGGSTNPLTQSTADGTIDAPGHHSFFMDGDQYYIAYHRHDNPHSTGGLVRQVCVDAVSFSGNTIQKVALTHEGIGALAESQMPLENLALEAPVSASSYYTDEANDFDYLPDYAADDNNGTIWKAGTTNMGEWLQIDLGSTQNIQRVLIDFEFPIYYYQYKIEYGDDGESWSIYADKTNNKRGGSPMLDDGDVLARYLKITITGVQKPGMFPAIWNVKVFNDPGDFTVLENPEQEEGPAIIERGNKLINIDAAAFSSGEDISTLQNGGSLAGSFTAQGEIQVEDVEQRRAFSFGGSDYLLFSQKTPLSLTWNSPYSVAAWVYNPQVASSEVIVSWANRGGPLGTYAAVSYGSNAGWGATAHWEYPDMGYNTVPAAGEWHHIVATFDGGVERVYVDGALDVMEQKYLYVYEDGNIMIGFSGDASEFFTGSLSSLEMYDYALTEAEIAALYADTACKATSLFPEIKLEQGSFLPTQKVGVSTGTTVNLHPSFEAGETDSGIWSWTGPDGFTSTSRDISLSSITESEFGEYTVSYTNECGLDSRQIFIIEQGASVLPDHYLLSCSDTENCSNSGQVNIAYGIPGSYFYFYDMDGNFECSSVNFGDPAPGSSEKQCYVAMLDFPEDGNIALIAEASTSYVSPWETLDAINDGIVPASSTDKSHGAYGNWNNPNSIQWVQYDWDREYYITSTDIYWFTDHGGLLIPVEAYVEYRDGTSWVKWDDIGVAANTFNKIEPETVYTNALRLSFRNDQESTGILEWRVFGSVQDPSVGGLSELPAIDEMFSVYPNPANDSFTIDFSALERSSETEVSILGLNGKRVHHTCCTGKSKVVFNKESLGLNEAIYLLKVHIEGEVYTRKLIFM